jgi:hypothetical protein
VNPFRALGVSVVLAAIFGGGGFGGGASPVSAGDGIALSSSGAVSCVPASGVADGCMTTGTQTIAGAKTLSGALTLQNGLTITTGAITMPGTGGTSTTSSSTNTLQQTGDGTGQSRVYAGGGAVGGGVASDSIDVVAWKMSTSTVNRSFVVEDRNGYTFLARPEWQYPSGGAPSLVASDTKVMARTGLVHAAQTLDTCAAGLEGTVEWDVLSGAGTTHRTRLCLCRSTGSSSYAWQNLAGASLTDLGTSTTCPD